MTSHKPFSRTAVSLSLPSSFSLVMGCQVSKEKREDAFCESAHQQLFFFEPDISAARHADVLFAKEKPNGENDLSVYCTKHGIKHLHFQDFSDATPVVSSIVKGDSTVEQIVG
jgi:2-hydroxy-3-keto-5-methylthiopentenyl-1-phosphate phosphatase